MFIKPVQEDPHPIVPQLHDAGVEAREDPAARGVEAEPLHTGTLRVQFDKHSK